MQDPRADVSILLAPAWGVGVPSTGPAYIVEALRSQGYRTQFIDYNMRLFRTCDELGFGNLWDGAAHPAWTQGKFNLLAEAVDLQEIKGDVIGFSLTGLNVSFSVALAERIRKRFPTRKIVFGGHAVFSSAEIAPIPLLAADALVKGDGEVAIIDLVRSGFKKLEDIPGLYLPRSGAWRFTSERPLVADLDTIAWPRYQDIDFDQYKDPYMGVVSSRGCLGNCVFCNERIRSPGYRVRSAANQVDELQYLSAHFNVKHFPYYDPLYNGDYKLVEEKCREILRRKLTVDYSGNLMVRHNMPDELFPLMRKSGFSVAFIGIESGSAPILKAMRKRHNPELAAAFLKKCHNAGIRTELNFIVGFPTETQADFQDTLNFIRENKKYIDTIISANAFSLGPGDLWDNRDKYGIVIEKNRPHGWRTADNQNNVEVRNQRLNQFLETVEAAGLMSDCLISNKNQLAAAPPPDIAPLLSKLGIEAKANKLTPQAAVQKLVASIRTRGLRQTVRRGREWLQINSAKVFNKNRQKP